MAYEKDLLKAVNRLTKAIEAQEGADTARGKGRAAAGKKPTGKKARAAARAEVKTLEEKYALIQKEMAALTKYDKLRDAGHQKRILEADLQKVMLDRDIQRLQQQQKASGTLSAADTQRLKDLKLQSKKLDEQMEKLDEISEAMEKLVKLGEDFAGAFKLDESVDLTGKLEKGIDGISNALKAGKSGAMMFAESLGTNLGKTLINNMAGLVLELTNIENAFMKATGASEDMARGVTEVYEANRKFAISAGEVSESYETLFKTATDFTMMNTKQQKMLAETGSTLAALGVSHGDYAKGIQASTKMLGLSVEEAEASARELTAFAKDIGVPPDMIASKYAEAGGTMAKFGKDGVKAFKDLSMMSKITGMDMNKILDITNKFDTFEGAADQAGKLNAALGGNFVNAMDLMMETDPTKRFEMIRDSISEAGLSFDSMSYYQKNFYKDALGLQDVGELAMMMGGKMDGLTGDIGKNSDELIAMKENAAKVASIQEQWTALIADMTPILETFMNLIRGITGWFREYSGVVKFLLGLFIVYAGVMKTISVIEKTMEAISKIKVGLNYLIAKSEDAKAKATDRANAAQGRGSVKMKIFIMALKMLAFWLFQKTFMSNFVMGIDKLGHAFGVVAEGLEKLLDAFSKNVKGALAFGAAMLLMGAGVALAGWGMAQLARAMGEAGENAGMAVMALVVLGAVILGLAAAIIGLVLMSGGTAVPIMLAFGAAMLMLGAAVALAGWGMSIFVDSLVKVTGDSLFTLAAGFFALGLSLMIFANPFMLLAAVNLLLLAGAFALIGTATENIATFIEHVKNLNPDLLLGVAKGFLGLAGSLMVFALPAFAIAAYNMMLMAIALTVITAAAKELEVVTSMISALGDVIEATAKPLGILESIFQTLTDPERIANLAVGFKEIAAAIDDIPTTKAIAMTATLGAAALAATTTAALPGGASPVTNFVKGGAASPGPVAAAGSERPYEVTINLQMGEDTITSEVFELMGGIAKRAIGIM